jgi:hypothetical protein
LSEDWEQLLESVLDGRLTPEAFHDAFFVLWRRQFEGEHLPAPVERLYYVVEAFTPDLALRGKGLPWEADADEVLEAARQALREIRDLKGKS